MTMNRQCEVTIIDSYPALAQDGAVRARYCAMVSRDPISPRSRRALNGNGRQFLELRSEICGTVTTVQKDTLVWIEHKKE